MAIHLQLSKATLVRKPSQVSMCGETKRRNSQMVTYLGNM